MVDVAERHRRAGRRLERLHAPLLPSVTAEHCDAAAVPRPDRDRELAAGAAERQALTPPDGRREPGVATFEIDRAQLRDPVDQGSRDDLRTRVSRDVGERDPHLPRRGVERLEHRAQRPGARVEDLHLRAAVVRTDDDLRAAVAVDVAQREVAGRAERRDALPARVQHDARRSDEAAAGGDAQRVARDRRRPEPAARGGVPRGHLTVRARDELRPSVSGEIRRGDADAAAP